MLDDPRLSTECRNQVSSYTRQWVSERNRANGIDHWKSDYTLQRAAKKFCDQVMDYKRGKTQKEPRPTNSQIKAGFNAEIAVAIIEIVDEHFEKHLKQVEKDLKGMGR